MKSIFLLCALFCLTQGYSQKITVNKVDEFLGTHIVKTDWFRVNKPGGNYTFFQVMATDSIYWLGYKKAISNVYAVDNKEMMIKFTDGEIATLVSSEISDACRGCGVDGFAGSDAWGIMMIFPLSGNDFEMLSYKQVMKIRTYAGDGYIEEEFSGEKGVQKALMFQRAVMLVRGEMKK